MKLILGLREGLVGEGGLKMRNLLQVNGTGLLMLASKSNKLLFLIQVLRKGKQFLLH
jgi:hypothetical protein